MTVTSLARRRQATQAQLAERAALLALRSWEGIDSGNLAGSWSDALQRLVAAVSALQGHAAGGAPDYHSAIMLEQGTAPAMQGVLQPAALSGYAADGRPLASLFFEPVIYAKTLIGQGVPLADALRRGGLSLGLMAGQEVRDAGRVADGISSVVDTAVGGYVRYLNLPSCSRCAILAGKFYRYNEGFKRHPRCDCVHVSVPEGQESHGLHHAQDPKRLFSGGQVTGLSKADEQAIADGADANQVVNAQRGMSTASVYGRQLKVTNEGVTKRGLAGKRLEEQGGRYTKTPRLRPEAIYQLAGDDRAEAIRLLMRFGYVI